MTIPLQQCQGLKKWAVLTTVQSPTEAVRRFIYKEHWCLIVVGDWEMPMSYNLETSNGGNIIFYDYKTQQNDNWPPFISALPWRSFGRKNVGFLIAIANDAEVIWDFDDDNLLKFWLDGAAIHDTTMDIEKYVELKEAGHSLISYKEPVNFTDIGFNPYPHLNGSYESEGNVLSWPRGFPLSLIKV